MNLGGAGSKGGGGRACGEKDRGWEVPRRG